MRSLSLLALAASGCAFVDAAGESHGQTRRLAFDERRVDPRFVTTAAFIDVDGDAIRDLVLAGDNGGSGPVSECLGTGDAARPFDDCTLVNVADVEGYNRLLAADLDGNGTDELIAGGLGKLDVITIDDNPRYSPNTFIALEGAPLDVLTRRTPAGDLSVLAIVNEQGARKIHFLENPLGTGVPSGSIEIFNVNQPVFVAADFATSAPGDELVLPLGDRLQIFGGQQLADVHDIDIPEVGGGSGGGNQRSLVAAGRFVGGDELDLVLLTDGLIRIFAGGPTDPSTPPMEIVAPLFINSSMQQEFIATVRIGDFDGDGRDDIVINLAGDGHRFLYFLLATEVEGAFQHEKVALEFPVDLIATGDFNGDGATDLVVFEGENGTVVLQAR